MNHDSDFAIIPSVLSVTPIPIVNIDTIASEFPILSRKINGHRLVYLDNSATTQKPRRVIDALVDFYEKHNANIHRGLHTLSNEASEMYERSHEVTAEFINARGMEEIVFTRNTTESLNLFVHGWGRKFMKKNDVVVITEMEHHSNVVPWQILVEEKGIKIEWVDVTDDGLVDMESYEKILNKHKKRVKVVSIPHVSNVLGTVNPVKKMCEMAKEVGAVTHLDAAQSAARQQIDVQDWEVDFVSFSSHKMYGPDGIGVLYGREELFEEMDPLLGGGGMIAGVSKEKYGVAELPWKFEAGTPNISDGAVFAEALEFINELGMDAIAEHERELMGYAIEKVGGVDGVTIVGPTNPQIRLGALSFVVDSVHPHDLSSLLDERGVAIRAGHHCAMPLHLEMELPATSRISLAVYNTKDDIDVAVEGIQDAREQFKK